MNGNSNSNKRARKTKLGSRISEKRNRRNVGGVVKEQPTDASTTIPTNDGVTEPTTTADGGSNSNSSGSNTDSQSASGGSGTVRRGRGRGRNNGNTQPADNNSRGTGNDGSTERTLDEENVVRIKRPRKKRVVIENDTSASVLLLAALIHNTALSIATITSEPLIALQQNESELLATRTLECMAALPKAVQKRFDKLVAQYAPFWNLGTAIVGITYPRYQIWQMRKADKNEFENEVTNTDTPNQNFANGKDVGNVFSQDAE